MANNIKQEELVEKMRELTDDIFNEDHLRNVLVPFINQQVRAALRELEHDYMGHPCGVGEGDRKDDREV